MKKPLSAVNVFAIILGIFLLIEGFWGLFSPVVFGVLTTNLLHAFIHLFLGVTGIYLGTRNKARNFSMYVGLLLLLVGILFFVPATNEMVVNFLNVNKTAACINIAIGICAILLAVLTPKRPVQNAHPHKA